MHRIFGMVALAAAGFGVWVLIGGPGADNLERARTSAEAPGAYSVWALGLLMGLLLAWLATIDWRDLPVRFGLWLRLQRRRLGLLLIGGACAGILLMF